MLLCEDWAFRCLLLVLAAGGWWWAHMLHSIGNSITSPNRLSHLPICGSVLARAPAGTKAMTQDS